MYNDSWDVAIGFSRWPENWKELNWKISDKKILGRSMWMDLSECTSEQTLQWRVLVIRYAR